MFFVFHFFSKVATKSLRVLLRPEKIQKVAPVKTDHLQNLSLIEISWRTNQTNQYNQLFFFSAFMQIEKYKKKEKYGQNK